MGTAHQLTLRSHPNFESQTVAAESSSGFKNNELVTKPDCCDVGGYNCQLIKPKSSEESQKTKADCIWQKGNLQSKTGRRKGEKENALNLSNFIMGESGWGGGTCDM